MKSLGRRVVIASLGGAWLVLACYALVAYQLEQWTAATDRVMLHYQRALNDGRLHVALTRASGEAASYVLSRNPAYRSEAEEALREAARALDALQRIVVTDPNRRETEFHRRHTQLQAELLQSMRARFEQVVAALPQTTDDDEVHRLLQTVYADEARMDALWSEMTEHHESDLWQGEQSLARRSLISRIIAVVAAATVALAIAAMVYYVRRRLVAPLAALVQMTEAFGAGNLKLRSPVTHSDEIGQLQLSFNRAAEQIERQRDALAQGVASLKASRDAAMAASQAKSTFLANVSHEIRTPLHSVIVSLDLLHDSVADPSQRRLAEVARSSARGLLGMLNDLLDVSRIEAGKLSLSLARFDMRELVAQVMELHGKLAADKGLPLSVSVDEAVPAHVCGDPQRVGQVLGNLLSNAIKFTEHGMISIAVTVDPPAPVTPGSAALGRLRICVRDTGVGVPEEERPLIFEPFFQAAGATRCGTEGLGLGLGIARGLSRLMGGDLGFESQVGKGSSFWFTVPLRPDADCIGAAPAPPPSSGKLPAGKSVLLVEDHAATREVMARTLRRRDLDVTVAENGRLAVDLAASRAFDLILMDCQMPEMDGFEATRRIRALGDERARVPIVGLTAYGLVDQKQRYLDAGFDDLVVKPYTLEEIERALQRWLVDTPRTVAAPQS